MSTFIVRSFFSRSLFSRSVARFLSLVLLGWPVAAHAQGDGSIRCVITSADHRSVMGARIAVESPERVVVSDANGLLERCKQWISSEGK